VQPPLQEAPYGFYRQEGDIKFSFNGNGIELPDTTNLLNARVVELNEDFDGTMKSIIKNLNNVINQALDREFGRLSKPRLVITYRPNVHDPFGILWIEHFVCETFHIEFDFAYSIEAATFFSLTWRYTNDGVVLVNRELQGKETRVPAFDCSERNQCRGGAYQKFCEGPDPKLRFNIDPRENNRFLFEGDVDIPASEIVAWVWDVFTAQPTEPFYEGNSVEAFLQKPGGFVRLTAITRKGCFGIDQNNIHQ